MKKYLPAVPVAAAIVVLIIVWAFLLQSSVAPSDPVISTTPPQVYVGVDLAYGNMQGVENQINQMSSYINLVIIGSTGITYNTQQLNSVCQFIYNKGLYFILYTEAPPSHQWLQSALNKWGNHFLGLYAYDEPGGKQLDIDIKGGMAVTSAANETDAANKYIETVSHHLEGIRSTFGNSNTSLFTSDYGLYWFDYQAGYDTVFAEFVDSYSRQLNVALVRGAAEAQNKSWGVMITYTNQSDLESGPDLLSNMTYAYNSGAKYIVVFDSNAQWTQNILQTQQLKAMQQFWQYMQNNSQPSNPVSARTAYVLPADLGYGFRGPNDRIWGLWLADNFTLQICQNLSDALQQYGGKLDIVYSDAAQPNFTNVYDAAIFWNGTTIVNNSF